MKELLIAFCITVSIAYGNTDGGVASFWNPFTFFPKSQGGFIPPGINNGRRQNLMSTTQKIVAQIGPGLVTDMTVFVSCGGKPMKFTEEEITSGFNCKNESSYACYKVCQSEKLGFIDQKDDTLDSEKMENHIFSMMAEGTNKTMVDLAECFKGKVVENAGKCTVMKTAMQCVWDSYYKNCEPSSGFKKNKKLVHNEFWPKEEKEKQKEKEESEE